MNCRPALSATTFLPKYLDVLGKDVVLSFLKAVTIASNSSWDLFVKFILPALLVGGLSLFSFTKPTNGGVNTLGNEMQKSVVGLDFKNDQEGITQNLSNNYNLSQTQLIKSETKDGIEDEMKRSWIFKSKLSMSFFDANFIVWGEGTASTIEAVKLLEVMSKYSKDPGVRRVSQSLYEVSSKTEFTEADKKLILDVLKKEYSITDEDIKKGVELSDETY